MVNEFDFIDNLKLRYRLERIGDDCAVLPKDTKTDMLLTADMLVEGIDFQLDWTTPEFLGHKALAVSLSDIAAMAGKPVWAMLSLAVPENIWKTDFVDRFYAGWFALAGEFNVELVGGDISRAPEKLLIDSMVGGEAPSGEATTRSGAQAGDAVFVTGTLGGAAGGLKLLERGFLILDELPDLTANMLLRQLKPTPKLTISNILQTLNVITSMIDLSDGISSDLNHICRASGAGARIYGERLPIERDLGNYFHSDDSFEMALNGGEDFELLFTVNPKNISLLDSLPVTHIGEITANVDMIELIRNGETEVLEPKGYRHF